ncbi:hypothetical protein DEU56DRAFT_917552 [Suillus clintonianus]|uniref:uncharacterized protein n=1 Tax=Suillus clintonianus TaxID=1904413 RepID=UPI001B871872|nr:uncharacterized protein DEU56DRAFT_917552 [Suillus clintonianus]KAG2123243.1 hypothetical protein DEU56DRAFT_917552 [Suillus clintonianus]
MNIHTSLASFKTGSQLSDYADRNPNLNDDEGDPLSRFLRMTDPQYATTTSSLKSLTSEMDAPPPTPSSSTLEPLDAGDGVYPYATTNSLQLLTSEMDAPPPAPSSSTSKPLDAGDDVYPVIPYSAQLDSLYNPPVPQMLAGSSQHPERNHRPRPSFTPYFIPEPRVLRPPEPTAPMAALAIPSTIAAPVASWPSTLVPLSLKFVAMQPAITASGVAPAAPAIFPGPAAVQPTTPALINVNSLVKKQILNSAKRRILRFFLTASAMAGTDGERAALVSLAISESSSMPGMNVTIRTTSSERQQVTAAWNGCFRKLLDMVRSCLALGYTFYPPLESNLQPVQFRGRVITALINDTRNPLAFMNRFTVDASGHVTILDGVLDNPLIFHVAVQFIWCSDLGISQFLSTSALHRHQQLNYAFGAIGAAVKLALREQIPHPPVILPFTQHEGSETFEDIVRYIGNMDGVQRIAFDYRKSHMLSIGDSQVRSTNVLAQLDHDDDGWGAVDIALLFSLDTNNCEYLLLQQVNEVQKKRAMENAVWMTTRPQRQRPAPEKPTVMKKTTAQRKAHVSVTKHGRHDGGVAQVTSSRPDTPDEILGLAAKKRRVGGVKHLKEKQNTKEAKVITDPD